MRDSHWRAYCTIVSVRYRMLLQYRAAALAGFGTQLFWGAIRLMILAAFYASATTAPPMPLTAVIAYVWLGQAFLGLLPWNVDPELATLIRTGGVSYELSRPLDLYTFWFFRTVAYRTAGTTLRVIPMVVFAMLLLPLLGWSEWALKPPPTWAAGLLFLGSIGMAVLLASAVTMLMHVMLVWTLSGEGINRIMLSVVTIFTGMVIPLPLFPDWLQPFLQWQPLRGVVDVPYRIYSGDILPLPAMGEILLQAGWVVLLIWGGRWLLAVSIRRLVVQGG
jgi:ABC-2 type transport system permease protein